MLDPFYQNYKIVSFTPSPNSLSVTLKYNKQAKKSLID